MNKLVPLIAVVSGACGSKRSGAPEWFAPFRDRVVAKAAQLRAIEGRDWSAQPVVEPIACVAYKRDSMANKTAVLRRFKASDDTWMALSLFANSSSPGTEGECLDYATAMAASPHDRKPEAEGKPCLEWFLALETVAIARPEGDRSGSSSGDLEIVELATPRVRFRAHAEGGAEDTDTSKLTAEARGKTAAEAQAAADQGLSKQVDSVMARAFGNAVVAATACK